MRVMMIMAMPQMAIVSSIIEDENELKCYKPFWYDDILPKVNEAKQEYNIDKVIILGPNNYTEHIKDIIQEHSQIKVELGEYDD